MNTYRKIAALAVTFSGLLLAQTPAIKVYVFSSGDSTSDGAITQALKDRGYQVTLGYAPANSMGPQSNCRATTPW